MVPSFEKPIGSEWWCRICKKTFTQKSSLIRHSKRCTPGPVPSLRQKSCRQCTASKTKCDLQRPSCSRCSQRDMPCDYVVPLTRGTRVPTSMKSEEQVQSGEASCPEAQPGGFDSMASFGLPTGLIQDEDPLGIHLPILPNIDLTCQLGPPFCEVGRELHSNEGDPSYSPFPGSQQPTSYHLPEAQVCSTSDINTPECSSMGSDSWMLWCTTPPLVKHGMETVLRVIRTWPKMLAKDFQVPPLLHASQLDVNTILPPLANCIAIAKMWTYQDAGASETIRRAAIAELRVLLNHYRSMDEPNLIGTVQATVIYVIILLFPRIPQSTVSLIDPALFLSIRSLAAHVASTGLILPEERSHTRPSWQSWIDVTSKRRAVFTLYLLHWSCSVFHTSTPFSYRGLGFLPAPAPKVLWRAGTREEWEHCYDKWLTQWDQVPYTMAEFEASKESPALERRSEIWLEDADELGLLIFSIRAVAPPCVQWW